MHSAKLETMTTPTEKEFRDAGYTADAVNYPLTERAFQALCEYNGVTTAQAPRAWRYAPNAYVRDYWERAGAAS